MATRKLDYTNVEQMFAERDRLTKVYVTADHGELAIVLAASILVLKALIDRDAISSLPLKRLVEKLLAKEAKF